MTSAVCPSETAITLKSACRAWEDHLWGDQHNVRRKKFAKLGGGFWEGGAEGAELGVQDIPSEQDEANEVDWETEVSTALKGVAILEGYVTVSFLSLPHTDYRVIISPRADHPFNVSQLFIILDRIELLLLWFELVRGVP
jgi:nuclear pore complex protein Nup107